MNSQCVLALPAPESSDTVVINARCSLRREEDQRVIVVGGLPVHHYRADDDVAQAYAMVLLVDSGFAQQTEVARAFEKSERTVRRQQERYAQDGMVGLGRTQGWRRGRRRISGKRLRSIEKLKSQGLSNRAIAQRLGVSEMAIRKLVGPSRCEPIEQLVLAAVARVAVSEPAQAQAVSSGLIADCADPIPVASVNDPPQESAGVAQDNEPVPMSLDRDASDRTFDRQMAYLGLLDDAAHKAFRCHADVRRRPKLLDGGRCSTRWSPLAMQLPTMVMR